MTNILHLLIPLFEARTLFCHILTSFQKKKKKNSLLENVTGPESFKCRVEATVNINMLLKSMMLVQHHVFRLFGGHFLWDVFMFVSIHVVI